MIYNAIFNDYHFILIDLYNINLHVPRAWDKKTRSIGWVNTNEVNTVMETAPFLDEQGIFQARCVDLWL